jgi:hypothetical protein
MSDNLLLLFQETVVGTYSDSDTTIEISSVSRLVDQLPLNLNLYDRNYGTAVDAFKAGFFEVIRVESLNVGDNEIVGLRGQEGTTPLTIGAGNWVVYQAINPKTISDKEDSFEKNTAFNKDFGTGEGTVAEGNDTRLLNNVKKTSDTGSAILPKGTEAQRDAEPTAGYLRFNEDENEFEGYNGTEWGKIGGGADVSLYNPITRIVETVTDTVDIGTAITKAFVFRNGAFVLPSEYIFDGDDLIFTEYDLDGTETAEEIVVYPITAEPLSVGIADNLTTDDPNQALSAKQGKVLEDNKVATSAIVNDLTTGGTTVPASAETVKVLNEKFKVLQVVQGSTSTQFSTTSTTYADTGLSATITPSSASSKIFVIINQHCVVANGGGGGAQGGIQLLRGSTVIVEASEDGDGPNEINISIGGALSAVLGLRHAITKLDSPTTTDPVTYKTQGARRAGTLFCQRDYSVKDGISFITLIEVAG